MGTKVHPGRYDCHAAALPDEPMFVLLARDPLAPMLTRLWGAVRAGNRDLAFASMTELQGLIPKYKATPETTKALEAYECSETLRAWRADNYGKWREPQVEGQSA